MNKKQWQALEIAELFFLGLAVIALGIVIAFGQWLWLAIALLPCLGMSWLNRIADKKQIHRQIRALKRQQARIAGALDALPSEASKPPNLSSTEELPTPQQWRALQQSVQSLERSFNHLLRSVNPAVFESRLQQVETLARQLQHQAPTDPSPAAKPRPNAISVGDPSPSAAQWQPKFTLAGHDNRVTALALSADGSKLLSGSWDCTLKLWQFPQGKLLGSIDAHAQGIQAVVWDGDRSFASGGYDRNLKLWTWRERTPEEVTFELRAVLTAHTGSIQDLAATSDGQQLFSGSYDQTIKRWQGADRELLDSRMDDSGAIAALALAPNQKWIASAGGGGRISLWQVENGDRLAVLAGNIASVTALAANSSGQLLAAGCTDGTIKLWSTVDLENISPLPIQTLIAHTGTVTCLDFDPSDPTLISAGVDGLIQVWHPSATEAISNLSVPNANPSSRLGIFSLALTPDGRWLAAGSNDGSIQIWEKKDIHG